MGAGKRDLARRLAARQGKRRLTDIEAEEIFATSKSVEATVVWTVSDTTQARSRVRVFNSMSENLYIDMRIDPALPGSSSWIFTWGDKSKAEFSENLRRLDLRASHRNPDGERWSRKTHKHRWSEEFSNRFAYTPTDIPHDVNAGIDSTDNYREVFEAFATECKIELGQDYRWSDPPLDCQGSNQQGLWVIS